LAGAAAALFVVVGIGVAAVWLGTTYFGSRQGPITTENPPNAEEKALAWEEFSSAEGNFKILMPGQPSRNQQPLGPPGPAGPGLPVGPAPVRVYYEVRTKESLFGVSYVDMPTSLFQLRPVAFHLDMNRNQVVSESGGQLASEKEIQLAGHAGRQMEIKLANDQQLLHRTFIVPAGLFQRFYHVRVQGPRKPDTSTSADKFFSSFALLQGEADRPNGTDKPPPANPPPAKETAPDRAKARFVLEAIPNVGHNALAFSADGQVLGCALGDREVKQWDPTTGKPQVTLQSSKSAVNAIAYGPDKDMVILAEANGTLDFGDYHKPKADKLQGGVGGYTSLVVSPNGTSIFTADEKGQVLGRFLASPHLTNVLSKEHQSAATALAASTNTKWLVSGEANGILLAWSLQFESMGQYPKPRSLPTMKSQINGLAVDADANLLAVALQSGVICLLNPTRDDAVSELKGHTGAVLAVALSPNRQILASGGQDHSLILWDVKDKKELVRLKAHTGAVHSVVFSPDGRVLAAASADGSVTIWDVEKLLPDNEKDQKAKEK
jgi:WD40 repeat protein